jgi:hypothetical protein
MIRIKKNEDIPLDIPQFSCDENAVGEHMNEHPLTQLMNVYGFLCVIGRPGSGKTSLTISLMTQKKPKIYRKTHHHMIILMPHNSIGSLKNNPFKVLPEETIYGELTEINIMEIHKRIDDYSKEDEKTYMTADLKKSKYIENILKRIIYNRRHLKCNVIITAQSYSNIPLDIRKNITNCILFKPAKKEIEILFEELVESKKDTFNDVMRITFDQKHNFLFVNIPSQRMFRNWDELIFKSDNDDLNS